jgi:hypothetical protein
MRILALVLLLLSCCIVPVAAGAERGIDTGPIAPRQFLDENRVALVIGNGAYRNWAPLANPVNDARAMADTLKRFGFQVITVEDATREAMRAALRDFGAQMNTGGVGIFYYAGHGTQATGENFLIPVDADIADEDEIRSAAISVQDVFARFERAENRLNVMILDACRVFPVKRSTRSGSDGLSRVNAPSGTLIAYATAPNQVAKDGNGKNSPYTKNLVAAINEHPGLKLEDLLKAVRAMVRNETGGRQEPWIESSTEGDFYFDPARRVDATVVINLPPPAGVEPRTATRRDEAANPRKVLADLGVAWSNQGFGDALMNADLNALELFLAAGWNPLSEYGEGNALAHFLWRASTTDPARVERILQLFVKAGVSPTAKVVRFRRMPPMDMASASARACNADALEASLKLGGDKQVVVRTLREMHGVSPADDGVPDCNEQIGRIGALLDQRFHCQPQAWDRTRIGCSFM